jgi:hypothetical protein
MNSVASLKEAVALAANKSDSLVIVFVTQYYFVDILTPLFLCIKVVILARVGLLSNSMHAQGEPLVGALCGGGTGTGVLIGKSALKG